MRIYLAGPIYGKSDAECKGWRGEVIAALPQHECIDPTLWDFRGKEAEHAAGIVERDREAIRKCDAVLVNALVASVGTSMEVLYAWILGKVVIVVAPANPSPWLTHHATEVVESLEQAVEWFRR